MDHSEGTKRKRNEENEEKSKKSKRETKKLIKEKGTIKKIQQRSNKGKGED
jgi:hypothetical protein